MIDEVYENLANAIVEQAVADGTLTEQRIDESVLRVLRMKLDRGIL